METFSIEQIITVSVLCVWFLFPLGMLVSFMLQDRQQRYPKITQVPKKKRPPEYHRDFESQDTDLEHDDLPNIPAHQIPGKQVDPSHIRF